MIIGQYREEKKVLDSFYEIKKNIEFVRRIQEALTRKEGEKKEYEEEERKRKANQMSE